MAKNIKSCGFECLRRIVFIFISIDKATDSFKIEINFQSEQPPPPLFFIEIVINNTVI